MNSKSKIEIHAITKQVFADIKQLQAYNLFKQFRVEEYPEMLPFTVFEILQNNTAEYHKWLTEIYMENLSLEEGRFNQMIKEIKKMSFSQSKILMSELNWHLSNWDKYPQYKK